MGRRAHRALICAAVPAAVCVLGAGASRGAAGAAGAAGVVSVASASASARSVGLPHGSRYVAIGSSYGAGYDITPQESGDGLCGRSFVDYPHLVAKKLHLRLDDVTCGGAVTANALNTAQDGHPPQVDAVTAKTRLVTITIGGNDVDYNGTAVECGVLGPACVAAVNSKAMNADFRELPHSLSSLVKAIRSRAPGVTIVLVPYPRLVPPTSCAALNYTPATSHLVASIGARLEKVFVKVAKATKIRIADSYVLGANHGPCAPGANSWIAGLIPHNGAPYHPTAAGHREMARLVERAL